MNEVDRKAYILRYTRQEYLSYHIPAFEYLINDFYGMLELDERIELVYALFFSQPDRSNSILEPYDTKFSDFLKFYPIWLDIVRLDENMTNEDLAFIRFRTSISKRRITGTTNGEDIYNEFASLFESINENKSKLTFEEILPGENQEKPVFNFEYLSHLIESELTEKEREVFELFYIDQEDHTQKTIADKLGISQSAVNQRLKSALTKLKAQSSSEEI
jgi:RNA polymerase sigma factor (sigma-70 family)